MRFLGRFIFYIFSNSVAILIAAYFISSFFTGSILNLLSAALILTIINTFIKPILEFLSTPFIMLTFGLFTIIINAVSVYLLDFFSQSITIHNVKELIITSLIISFINFLLGTSAKKGFKE